jgi:tetratricopeptide (TPR) repeat protein
MPPDNKAKILRDAEKYVLQGKLGSAISEYLKVTKTDPADVLTLNTIGDLYLRQGQVQEATKYFSQVAESYTKNNFLLKAIAVYKKILSADPDNIEMNGVVAALYAKQGHNVEARTQYLKVAELLAREGKARDSREAYEKVAELDPSNAAVQTKLGDIYLAEGSPERSHGYFLAAARAQTKSGNVKAAVDTYAATLDRNPLDVQGARGFLQAAIQLGDLTSVIRHLGRALQLGADELPTRQMLGQAYLAAGRLDEAGQTFESILNLEDTQYENFFSVAKAFLDKGDFDHAVGSIETILPVLIDRRETERGIEFIQQVLKTNPQHLGSFQLLIRAYSAVNDVGRQTETLERLVTHYLSRGKPAEALGYIDQILQLQPGSDRHLRMHRQTFQEAFPDKPYRAPAIGRAPAVVPEPALDTGGFGGETHGGMESRLVEVDLHLSYGARDTALSMLLQMVAQDPSDREVRKRLITVYRESNQPAKAAEQCLHLATSFRAARNEEEAAK